MITRDLIQGFIDGYISTGGDPAEMSTAVAQYLAQHPTYPQDQIVIDAISSDLKTYRVTDQVKLAPAPLTLVPVQAKVVP